jgi:putative transposase
MPRPRKLHSPFRYFNSSPEVIRLVVLMYVRFPLSLRNVEDLLFERGIDICHETVRHWWNRFGPMFAADVRRQRVCRMTGHAAGVGAAVAANRGVQPREVDVDEVRAILRAQGAHLSDDAAVASAREGEAVLTE